MGAFSSLATLGLESALAEASNSAERERLRQDQRQRTRGVVADAAEEDRRQRQALARRLAQERARMGAMGVGTTGGSSDAVLRGLTDEADAARAARQLEVKQKLDSIRQLYSQQQKRNILESNDDWLNLATRLGGSSQQRRRNLLD